MELIFGIPGLIFACWVLYKIPQMIYEMSGPNEARKPEWRSGR